MLRIGLTSDTHIGITTAKAIRKMLLEMREQAPDVIVHAGDFCGGHVGYRSVRSTCRLMREVFPDTPIVAVLGNHDSWSRKPRDPAREAGWVEISRVTPPLYAFTKNMAEIRKAFATWNVHFLDDAGPFRFRGTTFVGSTGWYAKFVATNDLAHLPNGLGGDTFRHMQKEAEITLQRNLDLLTDADTYRIFVSHFPVINPADFGWSEKLGEILIADYGIKKFFNGHFHQRHEGPLKYESGSDYGKPRYLMVEA